MRIPACVRVFITGQDATLHDVVAATGRLDDDVGAVGVVVIVDLEGVSTFHVDRETYRETAAALTIRLGVPDASEFLEGVAADATEAISGGHLLSFISTASSGRVCRKDQGSERIGTPSNPASSAKLAWAWTLRDRPLRPDRFDFPERARRGIDTQVDETAGRFLRPRAPDKELCEAAAIDFNHLAR